MKNKNVFFTVILTSSVGAICLLFFLFSSQTKAVSKVQTNNKTNAEGSVLMMMIKSSLQKGYLRNNSSFGYKLTDMYDTEVAAATLASSRPKLVLRYSELNCNVCVDSALYYFNDFITKVGPGNAVLLVEYDTPNYLSRFVKLNNVKTDQIYRILPQSNSSEANDDPYLFVLDRDMQMKDVFYPLKESPELSVMYYTAVFKKYFK